MKAFRLLFMLIAVSVFSTSIGAVTSDWRKSSKNVVDDVGPPTDLTSTKKVTNSGFAVNTFKKLQFTSEQYVERVIIEDKMLTLDLPELVYYTLENENSNLGHVLTVTNSNYTAYHKRVNRLPRDGIRYC